MKRILFVDDEIGILDGIRRMLRADRTRWEMQFVTSGDEALRACEASPFDLIITDMRMPAMDGASLLHAIKERWPSTVRCILSGYSESELTLRAVPVTHRFLSKPLKAEELRSAIERLCTLQDALSTPQLREMVGSIGVLPSLSSSYLSLMQAVRSDEASIHDIAAIVEHDGAMSAKILQLVNSGFFGLSQRITKIDFAIQFLGMETIKNLALTSAAFRLFEPHNPLTQTIYMEVQEHARRTAAVASELPIAKESRDILIVAALLHDIGKLIFASKMPDRFCMLQQQSEDEGLRPFEVEEKIFGVSHAEIGAYLLGLWGIDNRVIETIAHHHHPARISHAGFDSSLALYAADLLAKASCASISNPEENPFHPADLTTLEALGLSSQFREWRKHICGKVLERGSDIRL